MQPTNGKKTKFRETKYTHNRSEGLTRRQNSGTKSSVIDSKRKDK